MKRLKVKLLVVGAVLLAILLFLGCYQRRPHISFSPDRKEIYLVTGNLLRTERRELRSTNGKWYSIEPQYGLPVELATPYAMRFNDYYDVVLEPGGTLAMVSNDRLKRSELRWMGDHWRHKDPSTTEWLEFPEPEPPDRSGDYK